MKFEEVIKIAGKEYIQEFLRQEHKEARLSIGFQIILFFLIFFLLFFAIYKNLKFLHILFDFDAFKPFVDPNPLLLFQYL